MFNQVRNEYVSRGMQTKRGEEARKPSCPAVIAGSVDKDGQIPSEHSFKPKSLQTELKVKVPIIRLKSAKDVAFSERKAL